MNKYKKGDQVIIIAGSDRKKIGKIISINGDKVVVEGINLATIHKKPTNNAPGEIVKVEKSIHISNVSHVENEEPVKVSFKIEAGAGKAFSRKCRISKKTGKKI